MSEIINNSASTSYTFSGSPNAYSATSNILPINYENSAGITVTKTANPSTFSIGDIITYTVTITNTGSSYMTGVRVIDDVGNGNVAYVLSSATLSVGGQTYPVSPIATNPLTFTLQQLPVGATMTLTYNCQVIFNLPASVSLITNSVKAIGYTASSSLIGYSSSTIQKKNSVNFSITKSSNVTDIGPGKTFNYYITLQNNTANVANVSSVTDNLPPGYTLISASLQIGTNPATTLSPTDYSITQGSLLTIPSMSGPTITVPAGGGTTVITLTGYIS